MNEIIISEPKAVTRAAAIEPELMQKWLDFIGPDVAPKTKESYTRSIKQFAQYLAELGEDHPTRDTIQSFKAYLKETHKPATVNAYIIAVRLFFRYLAQVGAYPNIADNLKGEKIDREHKRDYLTADQCRGMLAEIDRSTEQGARDFAIIATMTTCGLRTVEVQRAQIKDFRTYGGNMVLFVQGKGKTEKADFVKIPSPTEKAIRDYLKLRGDVDENAPLFGSLGHQNAGEPMTTRSISRIVKEAMREIGFDDNRHTAHSLRHTAVTLALLGNGGNVQEAQQFARHADISTTMIYAHNLEKTSNTCAGIVANAIF